MELKATIKSLNDFEELLIKSMPHELLHDGSKEFIVFGENHKSPAYSKLYHLFPKGAVRLWEDRVNVRFYYDERFGMGTVKISEQGTKLLGKKLATAISNGIELEEV